MTLPNLLSFALAMFILAVIPGPGVMATVACSFGFGFRAAVSLIIGIVIGDLIFLLAAIYGLFYIAEIFT